MKKPYKQGLANQFGRESCAGPREGTGEALTAESPGQPWNSEIILLRVPTLSCQGEGHTRRSVPREFLFDATESETLCMDGISHRGNRETSVIPCGEYVADGTVGEGVKPQVRHARHRGVGRSRSTCEAGEQSRNSGGGVRGGKGIDQGKRYSEDLLPDSVPEHVGRFV